VDRPCKATDESGAQKLNGDTPKFKH